MNYKEEEKALIVKKENPLLKIPFIKKIYKLIQDRKQTKLTPSYDDNVIRASGDQRLNMSILNSIENQNDGIQKNEINNTNNLTNDSKNNSQKRSIVEDLKIQNFKSNQPPIKQETIVVGDLHGRIERWQIVKSKLIKNPNLKAIILGDAMDRGEYGPEILLQIKELSDRGRVQYLPGNHDIFAYNYLKTRGTNQQRIYRNSLINLEGNGGKITRKKLDNFDSLVQQELKMGGIHNKVTLEELTNWLGKQPIQKAITENGANFALAHAMFEGKLYNQDPNFNLEKALNLEIRKEDTETLNRFNNCMWYREKDSKTHYDYDETSFPKNAFVVVGHTPQTEINNLYLYNKLTRSVIYVDCGRGALQAFNLTTKKVEELDKDFDKKSSNFSQKDDENLSL